MRVDEKLLYQHLGWMIKKKRMEIKLSQTELGDEVGVNRSSIANIEAGRHRLPIRLLYDICIALDVKNPSELLPTINEATTSPALELVNLFGDRLLVPRMTARAIENRRRNHKKPTKH